MHTESLERSVVSHTGAGHRRTMRGTAVVLALLGLVPLANLLTLDEPQRWWGPAVHQWLAWVPAIALTALLLGRLAPARCEALRARWESRLLKDSPLAFSMIVGTLATLLAVFFAWLLFRFHAASLDELSAQWQAHILSSLRLTARAEPHDEFFSTSQTVTHAGRWFAHFPIGGPLLQCIGLLLGVPWLVNPLLAGVIAVTVYRFTAAVGTELQGRITALLFAISPFVLVMAATQRDHLGTSAAVWLALLAVTRWHSAHSAAALTRAAAMAGVCLGAAIMIRPYDGVLATLPIGLFQLVVAGRDGARWRSLGVQALAGAIPIAVLLGVNVALTGHPLTFAYDVLNGPEHRPGFHMSPLGFEHTPRHGLYLISSYLMRLNAFAGWPVPVVGLAVLALLLQRRASRWDTLLVALLGSTLAGYFFYWGEGLFNGPRFLYMMAPVFLIFIARLPGVLRERTASPTLRAAASLLIPLCCAAAWLAPASARQPFGVWSVAARTQQVDVVSPMLQDAARRAHLANALVFVNDGWQSRLSARLRALGVAPFLAQLVIGRYDACVLQQRLDDAERAGGSRDQQAVRVMAVLDEPTRARPLLHQTPGEQISLTPGQPLPARCQGEMDRVSARGMDMARLLPLMALDSAGRLGGDVVYARDFGARNDLLRNRFPTRAWYVARVQAQGDSLGVAIEPYPVGAAGGR